MVLPVVYGLIEEWESAQVAELLASSNSGNQIKFFCLVKSILGNLMEEVLTNWTTANTSIMEFHGLLVHLDRKLANLDVSLAGGKYSMERCYAKVKHPPSNFSRVARENVAITFQAAAVAALHSSAPAHEPPPPFVPDGLFSKGMDTLKV